MKNKKQEQTIEDFVGKAKRAKKVANVVINLGHALELGADKKYIASVYRELAGRKGTPQDVQLMYLTGASGLERNRYVVQVEPMVVEGSASIDLAEALSETGVDDVVVDFVDAHQPQPKPQGFLDKVEYRLERTGQKIERFGDKVSTPEGRREVKEKVVEGTKKAYDATSEVVKDGYHAAAPVVKGWWNKAKDGAKGLVDKLDPPAKTTTLQESRAKQAERDADQREKNQKAKQIGQSAYEKFQAKYGRRK